MNKTPRFFVGGCEQINGKWHAVFEVHSPCVGEDHKGCTVLERNVSPSYGTPQEAIDVVMAIKDESGLEGWEATGSKT
jgi:hypothetical protein